MDTKLKEKYLLIEWKIVKENCKLDEMIGKKLSQPKEEQEKKISEKDGYKITAREDKSGISTL